MKKMIKPKSRKIKVRRKLQRYVNFTDYLPTTFPTPVDFGYGWR